MKAEIDHESKLSLDFSQQKVRFRRWVCVAQSLIVCGDLQLMLDQFVEQEKLRREEMKSSLRDVLQKKQTVEERQSYELKIYKGKVKHLLSEHQVTLTDERIRDEQLLDTEQRVQRQQQHDNQQENRRYHRQLLDAEVQHLRFKLQFRQQQEDLIDQLRQSFAQRAHSLKLQFERKQRILRDERERQRLEELEQLEHKKSTQIQIMTQRHQRVGSVSPRLPSHTLYLFYTENGASAAILQGSSSAQL